MFLLSDIITYVRRIIKSPTDAVISDDLIIDYINRFYISDVDAEMQLFDLKTRYKFVTTPGIDQYNMPLYDVQVEGTTTPSSINFYPVYQGFEGPAYVNGIQVVFQTERNYFYDSWFNLIQPLLIETKGNGTSGPYTIQLPILPGLSIPPNPPLQGILRGHVDIEGIISTGVNQDPPLVSATQISNLDPFIQDMPVTSVNPAVYITTIGADGSNIVITDSGQFLDGTNGSLATNYGLLMQPGNAPFGNLPLGGPAPNYSLTQNTINYFTGLIANLYFPEIIPAGNNISAKCQFFETGFPTEILYYDNTIVLRTSPAFQYIVELTAFLSPAAFLNSSQAVPFAYMAEYIARGAARKILSDTGDVEQFNFYEPLFIEQRNLVWKRSQRQWTATRTQTLYSQGNIGDNSYGNRFGNGGAF